MSGGDFSYLYPETALRELKAAYYALLDGARNAYVRLDLEGGGIRAGKFVRSDINNLRAEVRRLSAELEGS